MWVVSVGIRAGLFLSQASIPEIAPVSERALAMDTTNIAGVSRSQVGETAWTMRRQGMISQSGRVLDAQ